jgi:penicillin-binding protein 1C
LSLAESAFLAGLPQSPNSLNPYRNVSGARKKQQEILRRMGSLGLITREEQSRALEERLSVSLEREKFRAPHFCDFVLRRIPSGELRELSEVRTTLDYGLQSKIEILLRNHLNLLEEYGITNGAVIVLDNRNGEILSMVGSKDFFDEGHDGQVNGATSLRQPGSALKPFTYALALEKGMTAATLIEDGQAQFLSFDGYYMPRNYDRKYHGVIRLRSALACSYNIPAISVLQTVGQDLLFRRLKELGFESLQKNSDYYGLGLTLGNGEVTLLELVRAYAALARGGMVFPETFTLDSTRRGSRARLDRPKTPGRRVFSPEVASITTDILSDKDARIPSFGYYSPLALPFPVAAKTGTSKDFRDNWTVGYTTKYTVGVWVGNFDGRSMHNVSGITGCGPLFKDIMLLLHKKENAEEFPKPENLVELAICPQSGELPSPRCPGAIEEIFIRGTEPQAFCSLHTRDFLAGNTEGIISRMRKGSLQVISPQSGDIFKIDPVLRREFQRIRLKASIPEGFNVQFVEWWVNSKKVATVPYPYRLSWQLSPGSYTVKAIALEADHNKLESRPVTFTVLL